MTGHGNELGEFALRAGAIFGCLVGGGALAANLTGVAAWRRDLADIGEGTVNVGQVTVLRCDVQAARRYERGDAGPVWFLDLGEGWLAALAGPPIAELESTNGFPHAHDELALSELHQVVLAYRGDGEGVPAERLAAGDLAEEFQHALDAAVLFTLLPGDLRTCLEAFAALFDEG